MQHLTNRILMAYRLLYMRGLLMDGQYRTPHAVPKPPVQGSKVTPPRLAHKTARAHVPVAAATSLLALTEGLHSKSAKR